MNTSEFIKDQINEIVEDLKNKLAKNGKQMTHNEEHFLRTGIGYGITISSLTLSSLSIDDIF